MYKAKKIPDEYEYETKKITIEVPKNLKMLTTVMVFDSDDNLGFKIHTKTYGTAELEEFEEVIE